MIYDIWDGMIYGVVWYMIYMIYGMVNNKRYNKDIQYETRTIEIIEDKFIGWYCIKINAYINCKG